MWGCIARRDSGTEKDEEEYGNDEGDDLPSAVVNHC
jgi:hypothetical protein